MARFILVALLCISLASLAFCGGKYTLGFFHFTMFIDFKGYKCVVAESRILLKLPPSIQ